jgi:anti-sigma factor RsiW
MNLQRLRHYSEEEILMHILGEEHPDKSGNLSRHLQGCRECSSTADELRALINKILNWKTPFVSEAVWVERKSEIMEALRHEQAAHLSTGIWELVKNRIKPLRDFVAEHPLATLVYGAAVLAFAVGQTIALFHLRTILPSGNRVVEIISSIF